jgi:hypothetical protein
MRLGVDEAGVTELMAVVEHTRCLVVVAGALMLERLGDEPRLVAAADPAAAPAPVGAVLAEIAASLPAGMPVPGLWRALARNPHHLESTWRKEQVVMAAGALSALDKRRVALAVAMSGRSSYMIDYQSAIVRSAGDDDGAVLEVLGVVDHYTALNTLSDAMQIDSDIRPPVAPPAPGRPSVPFPAPKAAPVAAVAPARVEPAVRAVPSGSDEPHTYTPAESAERKLRIAMAAEAKAERAQRDKIKKGFFGCVGVIVLLFVILMLFF